MSATAVLRVQRLRPGARLPQRARELGPKRLSEFDRSTLPRIHDGAASK